MIHSFFTENELLTAIEQYIGLDDTQKYQEKFLKDADFRYRNDPDSDDYTAFGGTSASAPIVSGVVALMLDARKQAGRPPLTWRDVQQILIETAEKNPGEDWASNTNAAGYSHTYQGGFGRVNAAAAADKAFSWTPVPEEIETIGYLQFGLGPLPEGENNSVSSLNAVYENIKIAFVEVDFTADKHPRWGDLEITLTSPTGTESVLATSIESEEKSYDRWFFGSWRHFGEPSQGNWKLTVKDLNENGDECMAFACYEWILKFYGTELPEWRVTQPANPTCQEQGDEVDCLLAQGENTVTLRPTTSGRIFANSSHGTYWFPPNDDGEHKIEILANLTPQRDWFNIPPFTPTTVTQSCDEGPPATEETYTADWWIHWQDIWYDDDTRGCRVSVVVEGAEIVAVEIDAPAGCDTVEQPEPSSGVLTATVTTDWDAGDRQETGVWRPAGERPGGVTYEYEPTCEMYEKLAYTGHMDWGGHWGETWWYIYSCETRDPWPPEKPEAQSFCLPPTDEELHDLTQPPALKGVHKGRRRGVCGI